MDETTVAVVQILLVVCGWLTSATIGALIGRTNGRVGLGVGLAIFGPLGWLIVAVCTDEREQVKEKDLLRHTVYKEGKWVASMMKCPLCAEIVKKEALKCRFCGHEFRPESLKLLSNP